MKWAWPARASLPICSSTWRARGHEAVGLVEKVEAHASSCSFDAGDEPSRSAPSTARWSTVSAQGAGSRTALTLRLRHQAGADSPGIAEQGGAGPVVDHRERPASLRRGRWGPRSRSTRTSTDCSRIPSQLNSALHAGLSAAGLDDSCQEPLEVLCRKGDIDHRKRPPALQRRTASEVTERRFVGALLSRWPGLGDPAPVGDGGVLHPVRRPGRRRCRPWRSLTGGAISAAGARPRQTSAAISAPSPIGLSPRGRRQPAGPAGPRPGSRRGRRGGEGSGGLSTWLNALAGERFGCRQRLVEHVILVGADRQLLAALTTSCLADLFYGARLGNRPLHLLR